MVEGPPLLRGDGGDVSCWDDGNVPRIVISCPTRPDASEDALYTYHSEE